MITRHSPALVLFLISASLVAADTTAMAADPGADSYAKMISTEPALVAWWSLERDCKDSKGTADGQPQGGQPQGGQPQFADGPGGGKALVLDGGRFVTMGNTPQLDLKETTVELWFQLDFQPPARYNPCIIAKRATGHHRSTRFSIHAWNDYSCLAIWNGAQVMKYESPEGPLRRGQWYYLAVTCTAEQLRVYLDGVSCPLTEGQGLFNVGQVNLPLSIGSSTPAGQELLDCRVDEVAFYRTALSEADVARHVDAMGWKDRRLELAAAVEQRIEREKKLRAEREARHAKQLAERLADETLVARGKQRVYRDESLEAVSLPLGGIGAGSIQINGRGERAVWQIFNNHKHAFVPHSFFAVAVRRPADKPVLRAMQTTPMGPFPAMKSLSFRGEYPFGWYKFEDPELPVKITMEAFSPLVPLDARNSAIPCAIFNLAAENPTDKPIDVTFLAAQQNAVGYRGDGPIDSRAYAGYGGNLNEVLHETPDKEHSNVPATILHMTSNKPDNSPGSGDMALAVMGHAEGAASWENLEDLGTDLSEDGDLSGPKTAGPTEDGKTIDGALALRFTLQPGQKRVVPFVLTWYFPNARHGNGGWGGPGNRYGHYWRSALEVARVVQADIEDLTRKTRLYHDTLYESNLPHWLLDRISSQVAVLRSQTCFWTAAGYFGGWEGCCPDTGCCHGNCNHVWHYAQAHARLFPSIARVMRAQEFQFQAESGAIPHRQPKSFPAFDGQCGAVLNAYREHLMSPDRTWLDQRWPNIKRAMDFVIATWDKDEDGVLAGAQWNTLDGALAGSSSWLGTLYLAALAAAEKMALLEDEPETAQRYARIRASGSQKQDETLFNGEYYIQIPEAQPHEDYGNGCHIDQVLGQWWAHQLDLGWLYPPERVRTALGSLLKYNFQGDFQGIRQAPRKFVADDDPGMQMIVWPKGLRPAKVIRYGDEVMTGFEYSAAAAMVQAGMLREGLMVTKAIYDRYDGRLRTGLTPSRTASWGYSGNPFGDDECGKFYARAMSVWSLLLACQGFVYDGPAGVIGFSPVWQPEDHRSFFTAAEGWGLFTQGRQGDSQTERIELRCGRLRVGTLVFELPEQTRPGSVTVRTGEKNVPAKFTADGARLRITLQQPVTIEAGEVLEVTVKNAGP